MPAHLLILRRYPQRSLRSIRHLNNQSIKLRNKWKDLRHRHIWILATFLLTKFKLPSIKPQISWNQHPLGTVSTTAEVLPLLSSPLIWDGLDSSVQACTRHQAVTIQAFSTKFSLHMWSLITQATIPTNQRIIMTINSKSSWLKLIQMMNLLIFSVTQFKKYLRGTKA